MGAVMAVGCGGEEEEKTDVTVAILAPTSGALDFVGDSFVRVAHAAVEEINSKGGVNGHEILLVEADDQTSADVAPTELTRLIDTEGAVGVVGPATSGAVTNCYPIAKEKMTPIVSPSSTAPSLGLPETDDGGYMFRNVPSDNIQGIAMAYYLTQKASPPVTQVAIVHEVGPYGEGLRDAFKAAFEANGGTIIGIVSFTQNEPSDATTGDAASQAVIDDLEALGAVPMTMMVALEQDGLAIAKKWDAVSTLTEMEWFLTDGSRSTGFLQDLPASMAGSKGTAPAWPITGDAYGYMTESYNERNDDDIAEQVFAPNVWDAFHLLAAALTAQSVEGEAFGGAGLKDALTTVSRDGQTFYAGQWVNLTAAIKSGADVDYDGAAGPNNFDDYGETIGPYEVWEIVDDGAGGYTFEQILFLEATDLEDL
jgi:ABC-type branched-subunit amino acid transport system substrate-binding protein